jgi:hypothetical protein
VRNLNAQPETESRFRRDNLTAIIMTAGRANMMRTLQLAAIGAFGMSIGGKRMVRAAHIAPRR